MAITACDRESRPARTAGSELVVVNNSEIVGIDPVRTGFLFARMEITETLLNATDGGEPLPGLAESWSTSDDGRIWTFVLRPTARFHDGTPVTAEAVAFVLDRARRQPGVFDYVRIENIRTGDGTVQIALESPSELLGSVVAHYSASIYAPASFNSAGLAVDVIGTGPYAMSELSNQGFALDASPHWDGRRPAVTRARYISVGRAETRSLMAESGQADVAYDLDPASIARLSNRPDLRVVSTMLPRTVQLNVNAAHPFLEDARARRALSLAIDRDGIANGILRHPPARATQLFSPVMGAWHLPSLPPLETDREEASRLLAELGWRPGDDGILVRGGERFRLRFLTYINRPELPPIATAIQAQLRLIGVETSITIDNQSAVPAAHKDGSLELALVARGYVNVADPVGVLALDFLEGGGDWGATGWEDARIMTAIKELARGTDPARESALRTQIAEILHAELPVIPVAWYSLHAAISPRVGNFSLDILERSYRISRFEWR